MVFILAALKEFDNEDLSDVLKRSYDITQGRTSSLCGLLLGKVHLMWYNCKKKSI